MTLSGAEYWMAVSAAFPLSLVVKLSRVSFPIDIDIFRFFFQTVSVPFLSFLPGGPQTCRGLNRPRLCPRTILYLYYLSLAITFLGSGLGSQWINGTGPQIIRPYNLYYETMIKIFYLFIILWIFNTNKLFISSTIYT